MTGRRCVAAQADVRNTQSLQDAVAKTIETFGRIDFVICGDVFLFIRWWRLNHDALMIRCCGEFLGSHIWDVAECIQDGN